MAERLKRAAAWLGLVTDDRYGEDDDRNQAVEQTEGISREELMDHRSAERVSSTTTYGAAPAKVTTLESKRAPQGHNGTSAPAPSPITHPPVASPRTADMSRIITIHPRTYNEARTIGEHFRDGVPVIMNLSDMEDVDAKRLVDFAAGLIFGLRGTIERVTSKVFLLSPHNVNVTAEDKERIAGGFFNQS